MHTAGTFIYRPGIQVYDIGFEGISEMKPGQNIPPLLAKKTERSPYLVVILF